MGDIEERDGKKRGKTISSVYKIGAEEEDGA
jgi:hypothetical protein